MRTYTNEQTGTEIQVIETGKSFKTIETAPATKHSKEYRKERKHRTYSGVQKLLNSRRVEAT